MKIGFIGLGNMGAGMAANLQKAGYDLVVYDIVREAAAEHIERGALWADTPAEVAQASEVIFTSLPGPKEVESVATGPNGVLAGISAGKVYVDLSTGYPSIVRRIHQKFAEVDAHMLDAPVSGSTIGANTGRLAVMAGGEEEVYERCKTLFEAIGDRPTYTGPIAPAPSASSPTTAWATAFRPSRRNATPWASRRAPRPKWWQRRSETERWAGACISTSSSPRLSSRENSTSPTSPSRAR